MFLNKTLGVPHKGWTLKDVIDLHIDECCSYGDYEDCEFCGQEQIRYVHIISHPEYSKIIRVGCICAEHLTNDYVKPREIENKLRNRAARRQNWLKRKWKFSQKGSVYLKTKDGYHVGCFPVEEGKFKAWIGKRTGKLYHLTIDEAKLAIFDALEKIRKKGLSYKYQ